VHTGNTAQVVEWVETQQVDIGVALKVRDAEQLGFAHLLYWRLECLLLSGHPLLARRVVKPDLHANTQNVCQSDSLEKENL